MILLLHCIGSSAPPSNYSIVVMNQFHYVGGGVGRVLVRSVSHLAGEGSPRHGNQTSGVELLPALVGVPAVQNLP